MTHPCPCVGCERQVRSEWLMCPAHWRQVPKTIQKIIWATVGVPGSRAEYVRACGDAVEAIAKKEGKEMPRCRACGCFEDMACEGGCYWVEPDLCSACAPVEALI